MTETAKRYAERVASLGCLLHRVLDQGYAASEIHHLRTGQGMSERASHFLIVPLCPDCHRGHNGLHGNRSLMNIVKMDELDLLALTIELVFAKHQNLIR